MSKEGQAIRTALAEWVVPPGLTRIWRQHRKSRISEAELAVLRRNQRFHGMFKGRRCFVIANGPSLAKQDLEPLASEITIVMNAFNRHPVLKVWKPTIYCRAEPAASYDSPERIKTLPDLIRGIDAQAYFFPIGCKAIFDEHGFLDPERTFYFRSSSGNEWDCEIDLTKTLPLLQDTSILATTIAVALGCSPIVLLGTDYDWMSHRAAHRHFYDASHPAESRPEGNENLANYSYLQMLKWSISSWSAHDGLRQTAERHGQRIYNATEGGFLDTYPQVTLAQALNGHVS